jgi:hypothetical protein
MSKLHEPEPRNFDEEVAALADHLMNPDVPDAINLVQDDETHSYLELLSRLSEMAPKNPLDQEMVARVRAQLESEWKSASSDLLAGKKQHTLTRPNAPSGYRSARQRRNFSLRLAFAALAMVILLAFFISPTVNHAIPGAAGGQVDIILFLGMLILLFGLALWWFFHRKG